MNTDTFFQSMIIEKKPTGVNIENPENNPIINEAIILDELKGDKTLLLEFYEKIGLFGVRDGVLNESAAFDTKINNLNTKSFAKLASVVAVAQESGSDEYELYKKAVLLMESTMDSMIDKFADKADERLQRQRKEVLANNKIVEVLCDIKK